MKNPIALVPIGRVSETVLRDLTEPLGEAFHRPVVSVRGMQEPTFAFNPTRRQFHSTAILRRIEANRDERWDAVLGVTDVDLFQPEITFVFGEANRNMRAAIVSIHRLRPERYGLPPDHNLFHQRVVTESIHELGHIYGLAHCSNNRCVMFYSSTPQETDRKGLAFCANCRKRLETDKLI